MTGKFSFIQLLFVFAHYNFVICRNNAISSQCKLMLALRMYATGSMVLAVSDFIGISVGSACRCLHQVSLAISSLRNEYIKMPSGAEVARCQQKFYNVAKFPRVIGAVDCTHIKIQSPGMF